MTSSTQAKIPPHLKRYIVDQNYARYTSEDQAVWRYIMRQLKSYLTEHAHKSYLEGLRKSGLEVEQIPRIKEIDEHLEKLGWGAVPVSGFIPPAAFMEFQSIGVLPIASDMRSINHLLYTPAPDIVHEAAGHAPILADPNYAAYLRQYGEVAKHSIISKHDLEQYEAIRVLSDLKEDPHSTPETVSEAEKNLVRINAQTRFVSEAGLLSRMNWWTAEYGLIGSLANPKIFGAGLLSSVGEARDCLQTAVRKIPLSVECVEYSYDITEPQPQLFVAADFAQLGEVLEQLAARMAYRRGGLYGLDRAIEAETVNTIELNSGLQISGLLKSYRQDSHEQPIYLSFSGPSQLCVARKELPDQGTRHHVHGFSSPLGPIKGGEQTLLTLRVGQTERLEFVSGVVVTGRVVKWTHHGGRPVILTWSDCRVQLHDEVLFDPSWGVFDMAIGESVKSVFGGPGDRTCFGQTEDFVAKQIPLRNFSPTQLARHEFFNQLRTLRTQVSHSSPAAATQFRSLAERLMASDSLDWLQGIELLELHHLLKQGPTLRDQILEILNSSNFQDPSTRACVLNGIHLAASQL